MKKIIIPLLLILSMVCNAQDRLQRAMERYEYGAAAQILDSLIKGMSADSIMVSQNKDRIISLTLQRAGCL